MSRLRNGVGHSLLPDVCWRHSALIPFSGDHAMRIYPASIVFCFCALLCHAQATRQTRRCSPKRARNTTLRSQNLQSFDCAVDFNWKEHSLTRLA